MPLVTGQIDEHGAAIGVFIGVSKSREDVLRRVGHPIPEKATVRLQIDTGSSITGILADVFRSLEIEPFSTVPLRTPSTTPGDPHMASLFDVSLYLVSGTNLKRIPSIQVIGAEDFDRDDDGVQGIIGRDVLRLCEFYWHGPGSQFELGYD